MKKAFVSVLLAVGLLSACSNQNIEIDHPTTPPTENVQEAIKPSEPSPVEVLVTVPVEPAEPTKQEATEPFVVNQAIEEEPDLVTVKKTEATTEKATTEEKKTEATTEKEKPSSSNESTDLTINVQDEETDEPVPGATVEITTPDGEKTQHVTDEDCNVTIESFCIDAEEIPISNSIFTNEFVGKNTCLINALYAIG